MTQETLNKLAGYMGKNAVVHLEDGSRKTGQIVGVIAANFNTEESEVFVKTADDVVENYRIYDPRYSSADLAATVEGTNPRIEIL